MKIFGLRLMIMTDCRVQRRERGHTDERLVRATYGQANRPLGGSSVSFRHQPHTLPDMTYRPNIVDKTAGIKGCMSGGSASTWYHEV